MSLFQVRDKEKVTTKNRLPCEYVVSKKSLPQEIHHHHMVAV